MDASVSNTSQNDETEREKGDRDVWSDLETLKNLYGLLDKTPGTNTDSTSEEILDHKSKVYLMRLLDEATQNTLTHRMKMLPGPLLTPQLAGTSSFQRSNQSNTDSPEQNLKNSLRYSFQRNNSNIFKSQFSIKIRQSQARIAPSTQASAHGNHPMSRYNERSGIDRSSKPVIVGSPIYRYHKEKSLCCPSMCHSRSSSHKAAEMTMTPKRMISVSPRGRTELRPDRVHLDRMSSRVKSRNQYSGTKKDCCSDGTTSSSSDSNSGTLVQRRTSKLNKRMILHDKRLTAVDHRKELRDSLSVDSGSQSSSVSSYATSSSSGSSSSRKGGVGTLPIVPFQKLSPLPVVPFQKSSHLPVTSRSRKSLISQHEDNKSVQRIQSTRRHAFASQRRNSKKLAKETDKPLEQNKGRLKRLKDKLAIVFHHRHDHHHYHHHHGTEGGSTKGQVSRANKNHCHRSLWNYLKGIVHHSSEQTADHIAPSQHHHRHRHLRALFCMLFGHLWRGNKRRNNARLGRTASGVCVKKLWWWHRFRTGRRVKLTYGKKPQLRLRYGTKGGSMKKGNKR